MCDFVFLRMRECVPYTLTCFHVQFVRATWPLAEVFAVCSSAKHGQDAGDVRRREAMRGDVRRREATRGDVRRREAT